MDREDNGRLRRSIQRQEYDESWPPPGKDAGYSSNGYPEHVGGDEVFFGGARRTTGEPERVGEYDEHGNQPVELDNRSSGTGRRRIAQQQDGSYPPEEAGYLMRDYHHHDPEGPETRSLPRHYDVDGRVEGEFTNRDGNRERGDLQPNGCADGRTGVHDFGQRGPGGRSGEESGGRESYRCSPRVRYRQHHRHGDDHHESARHVRDGAGVGFTGRDSRNSSSSGSSDRGSIGRQNFTQVDVVDGSTVTDPGPSRAKRVEFSQGIQGPAHEPRVPRSSVRRHLVSPKAVPPQRAAASPKVQKCAQDSPAKRWRSQAERSISPVSTGTQPCAADSEDKTTALVKTPKDMLLFSKKARQVDYKPCTLKEYREAKPTGYVELGKLQPDLYTDELVAKRANAERIKEFSTNLRKINSDTAAARGDGDRRPRPKKKDQDSRTRALAFARKIPLPRKVVKAQQPPAADPGDPGERRRAGRRGRSGVPETEGWRSAEMTELEALEAMHDDMRKKVQEARSSF
ncbi:conserved unknown protein [Ectocarpus siliculosus]|uniref:Uncharacterized protein n=1 Tax=Ectocarpus siliculosus TaxID=2880 RepID=D8LRG3_ECTSI|nr:conserved unknown protein [Ectocarpus siliculosus]|eukprot:CBN75064.1 conserved unknown protein [Ectocarpus siliculosus]